MRLEMILIDFHKASLSRSQGKAKETLEILTRIWGIIHVNIHAVSVGRLALQLLLLLLDLIFALAINVDATVFGHFIVLACGLAILSSDADHSGIFADGRGLAVGSGDSGGLLAVVLGLVCAVILIVGSEIGLGLLRRELGRGSRIVVPRRVKAMGQLKSQRVMGKRTKHTT